MARDPSYRETLITRCGFSHRVINGLLGPGTAALIGSLLTLAAGDFIVPVIDTFANEPSDSFEIQEGVYWGAENGLGSPNRWLTRVQWLAALRW